MNCSNRTQSLIESPCRTRLTRGFIEPTEAEGERIVRGVWGLHVYDFWSELNEYLLGHIFEESLSDLHDLGVAAETLLAEKVRERKSRGIFFTNSILADFLCACRLSDDA